MVYPPLRPDQEIEVKFIRIMKRLRKMEEDPLVPKIVDKIEDLDWRIFRTKRLELYDYLTFREAIAYAYTLGKLDGVFAKINDEKV